MSLGSRAPEERVRAVRKAGLLLSPYYFARVASPENNQRDGEAEAKMVLGFAKSRGCAGRVTCP